jgi:hypothetical protein
MLIQYFTRLRLIGSADPFEDAINLFITHTAEAPACGTHLWPSTRNGGAPDNPSDSYPENSIVAPEAIEFGERCRRVHNAHETRDAAGMTAF